MNRLFKFSAFNSQTLYGWGRESEASSYCDYINRDRKINVYSFSEISCGPEISRIDSNGEGVNLFEALEEITRVAQERGKNKQEEAE